LRLEHLPVLLVYHDGITHIGLEFSLLHLCLVRVGCLVVTGLGVEHLLGLEVGRCISDELAVFLGDLGPAHEVYELVGGIQVARGLGDDHVVRPHDGAFLGVDELDIPILLVCLVDLSAPDLADGHLVVQEGLARGVGVEDLHAGLQESELLIGLLDMVRVPVIA